jgi:hypothetical protein
MRPHTLLLSLFAGSLFFAATAFASQFDRVIDNPRSYHNKHVTVRAVAYVEPGRFILYKPRGTKMEKDFSHEIFGLLQIESPSYARFNGKWVEVTGIVDANEHGLAFYRCGLIVHRVRFAHNSRE